MSDESPFLSDFDDTAPVPAVKVDKPAKAKNGKANGDLFSRGSYLPETHRLLPQDPDAEQGVLCSFLLAPNEVGVLCSEKGITPEHFHIPAHATIYKAIVELWSKDSPIDFITLGSLIRDYGKLADVGGHGFVSGLFTYLPTAANASYYVKILTEKYIQRQAIQICTEHAGRLYDEQDDVAGLLVSLHAAVTKLVLVESKQHKSIRQLAIEAVERIEERGLGHAPQIRTGIEKMDLESPVRPGDFVIVAGRRKSGKSALVSEVLKRVSVIGNQPAAVFSLEMPDWQWIERLIANLGTISLRSISRGRLEADEASRLIPTTSQIGAAPIELFDGIYDLPAIVAKLRQLKAKIPSMNLAVIDYGQLVRVASKKGTNREQEVAEVSRTLRLAASDLGMALIVLSQLNEFGETRESKSLEQDCTAMWKVLEELDDKGNPKKDCKDKRTLWVPFQRNGPPDIRVRMQFQGHFMRFTPEQDEPALPL